MTFNSFEFLIFFPIFLLCYFLLPKKLKMPAMLAMSYWFYAAWNFHLLALIIFTTAVSYFCALAMEKTDKKSLRRLYITLTLIVCLGTLFFFKYYNFMAGTVSGIMSAINGKSYDFSLNLILPVGISFYTFQTLSYAIDVYRGDIKAERNFFWYALFVSFFPQLVAGPIERPENLLPQLKNFNRLNAENAFLGMQKMAVGFFKKIAVADILAGYVNSVYNDIGKATAIGIIIATVLFAVQIYCDFSGYTDIAIGCARIMGIRLMQNFDRPYSARSIKEFWDRWHISLSTWFRDYLYIPLGGNRCSRARYYLNLFIVFLVSGLWHGANWTFVIWGALHGFFRIFGSATKKWRMALYTKMGIKNDSRIFAAMQRFTTFFFVCLAWIFFRANSIADVGLAFGKLFSPSAYSFADTVSGMGLTAAGALYCALAIAVLILMDRVMSMPVLESDGGTAKKTTVLYSVWAVIAAWVLILSVGGASTFIYFQF